MRDPPLEVVEPRLRGHVGVGVGHPQPGLEQRLQRRVRAGDRQLDLPCAAAAAPARASRSSASRPPGRAARRRARRARPRCPPPRAARTRRPSAGRRATPGRPAGTASTGIRSAPRRRPSRPRGRAAAPAAAAPRGCRAAAPAGRRRRTSSAAPPGGNAAASSALPVPRPSASGSTKRSVRWVIPPSGEHAREAGGARRRARSTQSASAGEQVVDPVRPRAATRRSGRSGRPAPARRACPAPALAGPPCG